MKLKITNIKDIGNIDKERIVMKVESTTDVGDFLLIQSWHNGESVTAKVYQSFWFPDKVVGTGDFVVLYTKAGKSSEKPFNEVKSHFFYWGQSEPLWNHTDRAAVLLHTSDWESYKPKSS